MTPLLFDKSRRLIEKGQMEYRPFGVGPDGTPIRDVSGVSVRPYLEYLEETIARHRGPEAGRQAVKELIRLVNERIPDPSYHVTEEFLRNQWNSYSYEFMSFLGCFCNDLSGDPDFPFHLAREKFVSPVILALARPFSTAQIFKVWPYFGEKYAPAIRFESLEVSEQRALLRVSFQPHVLQYFGPYRRACAHQVCLAIKGTLMSTPERVHGLKPAKVVDLECIANDDPFCTWEVTWEAGTTLPWRWIAAGGLVTILVFALLRWGVPELPAFAALLLALPPGLIPWLLATNSRLRAAVAESTRVIQEQVTSVDSRHEELRDAYVAQHRTSAALRQKVNQLTLLHRTGLTLSSSLDRETLIRSMLEHIKFDLHYDRVMFTFYDRVRQVGHDARVLGVPHHIATFARKLTIPIGDPNSIESQLSLQGRAVLVKDIREVWDQLHPMHRELAALTKSKAFIAVPLKVKDRILGSLTVDHSTEGGLNEDDLELMQTVAGQVAIALDNAEAYREIENLNIGLEAKVRERTLELAQANERLQEMDRLKSQFVAHVSHELRTPLTIISGFVDNMLEGITGPLSDKQSRYLDRIKASSARLARMIANLLHRSRIEEGKEQHFPAEVSLTHIAQDVVDQLRHLAAANDQQVELVPGPSDLTVWADADGLSRILTNLVENAIKYTRHGGSIQVRLAVQSHELASVSVVDTGDGIAAGDLPKLFDPFYRSTRHQQAGRKDGLGLGLSIVKQLVELHGGTVSVQSQEGVGSTFRFTLPLRRPTPHRTAASRVAHKRILLVDDDPDIRHLLADRLTADGYEVLTAADGQEAVATFNRERLDGLILDIGLPHIDGLGVLQHVRAQQRTVPVIMITAAASHERAREALIAGAQAYLLKPLDAQEFKRTVDRWFRGDAAPGAQC